MELPFYFENIIARQRSIGYHMPKVLRGAADNAAIAVTERMLKLNL
jgi:hypothetical protein